MHAYVQAGARLLSSSCRDSFPAAALPSVATLLPASPPSSKGSRKPAPPAEHPQFTPPHHEQPRHAQLSQLGAQAQASSARGEDTLQASLLKWKVVDLQAALQELQQPRYGTKAVLVGRLMQALSRQAQQGGAQPSKEQARVHNGGAGSAAEAVGEAGGSKDSKSRRSSSSILKEDGAVKNRADAPERSSSPTPERSSSPSPLQSGDGSSRELKSNTSMKPESSKSKSSAPLEPDSQGSQSPASSQASKKGGLKTKKEKGSVDALPLADVSALPPMPVSCLRCSAGSMSCLCACLSACMCVGSSHVCACLRFVSKGVTLRQDLGARHMIFSPSHLVFSHYVFNMSD